MDNFLENVFGDFEYKLNLISGIILILIGVLVTIFNKNKESKNRNIIIYICLGLGILGTLSGIIQMII